MTGLDMTGLVTVAVVCATAVVIAAMTTGNGIDVEYGGRRNKKFKCKIGKYKRDKK